ncbi:CDC27 family protein [Maribacter sp. 2210JD10-5]|uniref:tetratricopeptide repeat protein n=1 Tax=Maribacter sp. 2210JD10-5 TaxID=3386272 RepID=UPI0039BD345A
MERETLLEKYLQDKLTESERQEFDALLQSDPEFKEEVEFQMDVKRALTAEEDDNFREILSDFESEARAGGSDEIYSDKSKVRTFPTKWLVAASVALLVGLTYFFTANQATDTKDLFTQNFKPYRNVTYPITRGEEAVNKKTKAFLAYGKGNYKGALPLFTELYASQKEPYYLFYKANALIELNRAEEAIPLLEKHLETKDSLVDKSYWYLAMAYLQLEDSEKAKQALKKVVETKAYKAEEAKQLLDVL